MTISVHAKVAEQIGAINPKVEDKVVGVLVERELTKRADALVVVLDGLSKLESDLKKIRPDMEMYSPDDGSLAASAFSKAKNEEKKKMNEKIAKYTNAITKALDKGDYGDVYNLKNQKPGGSGDSEKTDTDAD